MDCCRAPLSNPRRLRFAGLAPRCAGQTICLERGEPGRCRRFSAARSSVSRSGTGFGWRFDLQGNG